MRKSKGVVLAGLEPIAMREMTVTHFPTAIRILKDVMASGDMAVDAIAGLVLGNYQDILEVLVDCSSLTADQFKEIGASDLLELVRAWVEANESFFDQVKGAAARTLATPLEPSSA